MHVAPKNGGVLRKNSTSPPKEDGLVVVKPQDAVAEPTLTLPPTDEFIEKAFMIYK